jgi:hypothetical protein
VMRVWWVQITTATALAAGGDLNQVNRADWKEAQKKFVIKEYTFSPEQLQTRILRCLTCSMIV